MKQLSQEEQEQYLDILAKHKESLMSYDGVRDVAIGYPIKEGEIDTNKISILVFVVRKFSENELSAKQIIPKTLDGIDVDVIESNPEEHDEDVANPLTGGIGISNVNLSGRGTLGMIVKKKNSEILWGLTNWHVIKKTRGKVNDAIVQPAWKPNTDKYRIGQLISWNQELDCAVFELKSSRSCEIGMLKKLPAAVGGIIEPRIGLKVVKSGARTGVTYGIISSVSPDRKNITIIPNKQKPAVKNEISLPGDSGAVWVTDEPTPLAVALHRAGDKKGTRRTEFAYARNFHMVANEMGFEI